MALLERRGYAVGADRLGELCLGGPVSTPEVLSAVANSPDLGVTEGLVVSRALTSSAPALAARSRGHAGSAAAYRPATLRFVRTLVRLSPYVLGVAIAGSLASGGFAVADDVDLNLIVEDGRRHLAYVALNTLGLAHALGHRGKPVDVHSRRPLAPRLMTANLLLERSQCFPLARQDADMAYELLASEPVFGGRLWQEVVTANPGLSRQFPQLSKRRPTAGVGAGPQLPGWLFPALLDSPARALGRAGWRYMQWTRRRRPEALARVAYVRRTMRPYALFDEP